MAELKYVKEEDYSSRDVAVVIDYMFLVENQFEATIASMKNEGFVPQDLSIHDAMMDAVMASMKNKGNPNLPEKEQEEAATKFADVGIL